MRIVCPTLMAGRNFSGTLKSAFTGSMASRLTSGWPAVMYSPTLTRRRPTIPENGATICALSSCTRASSTAAVCTATARAEPSRDGARVRGEGGGRVVCRLGRRVLIAKQSGAPLVGLLGELKLGFGIGELGAIDRIFDRDKWRFPLERL